MEETTYRQYRRLWLPWLDEEWNRPNRTDNYLMGIIATLVAVNSKDGSEINPNDYVLKFKKRPKPASSQPTSGVGEPHSSSENSSPEEKARETSKSLIGGFVGAFGKGATFLTRTPEEAERFKFKQLEESNPANLS